MTIKDLPIGTYTVTEDTSWSWRYTPDGNGKKVTVKANAEKTVTFTNTRDETKWLNGGAYKDNRWTIPTQSGN